MGTTDPGGGRPHLDPAELAGRLPAGFELGASTAAYQIEGAVDEDGRGRSVWDTFCDQPGRVVDGSSGAVACDHYHRYREDVALLARLGVDGYRFSVAWPRVLPDGHGAANPAGLAFYDRLVDELLDAGVAPMATLFHWDLPQALEDRGGWLERGTAERFADYVAVVADRLGDRVAHWVPVNEPNVVTMLGYATGVHAPGRTLMFDALPVAHHLLLGHGLAVQALRAAGAASVGTATNHTPVRTAGVRTVDPAEAPGATGDAGDRAAAELYDTLWNRLFADPVLLGRYPDGYAELMPGPVADDLRVVSGRLDFYGVNYYNPTWVGAPGRDRAAAAPVDQAGLPFTLLDAPAELPRTGFGWPVVPAGLREVLEDLRDRYGAMLPSLYVTESGCSYPDEPGPDGTVDDAERVRYLHDHLAAVADAVDGGVDVRGYFTWSLVDNFEWAEGYTQRFGLVHVDYATLARTPKRSFHWFADVAAALHRRR